MFFIARWIYGERYRFAMPKCRFFRGDDLEKISSDIGEHFVVRDKDDHSRQFFVHRRTYVPSKKGIPARTYLSWCFNQFWVGEYRFRFVVDVSFGRKSSACRKTELMISPLHRIDPDTICYWEKWVYCTCDDSRCATCAWCGGAHDTKLVQSDAMCGDPLLNGLVRGVLNMLCSFHCKIWIDSGVVGFAMSYAEYPEYVCVAHEGLLKYLDSMYALVQRIK